MLYTNDLFVEVIKEVYLEWYQFRRREKYQIEKYSVCSLERRGIQDLLEEKRKERREYMVK